MGDCELTLLEVEGARAVDLGYDLRNAYRCRGLATEAARPVRGAMPMADHRRGSWSRPHRAMAYRLRAPHSIVHTASVSTGPRA